MAGKSAPRDACSADGPRNRPISCALWTATLSRHGSTSTNEPGARPARNYSTASSHPTSAIWCLRGPSRSVARLPSPNSGTRAATAPRALHHGFRGRRDRRPHRRRPRRRRVSPRHPIPLARPVGVAFRLGRPLHLVRGMAFCTWSARRAGHHWVTGPSNESPESRSLRHVPRERVHQGSLEFNAVRSWRIAATRRSLPGS